MEFTVSDIIPAKRKHVFKAWLDSKKHSEMTGGAAEVSDKPGDTFTAWDGYISGTNLVIEPKNRILQFWRTSEFSADEKHSTIEVMFDKVSSGTKVTIVHTNLPEHGEQYKQGWIDHYFTPMKSYFGD